jgi:putative restriction endonuclease
MKKDFFSITALQDLSVSSLDSRKESGRIREEFNNGKEYYAMHGRSLAMRPGRPQDLPDPIFLAWYNEHVFKAE